MSTGEVVADHWDREFHEFRESLGPPFPTQIDETRVSLSYRTGYIRACLDLTTLVMSWAGDVGEMTR